MELPHASSLPYNQNHTSTYTKLGESIVNASNQGSTRLSFLVRFSPDKLHDWELEEIQSKGYSISFFMEPLSSKFYGRYEVRWDGYPISETTLD